SIWSAIDAGDPLERSADSLMAAQAGLDLIAAVANWAPTAAEVGAATVATICSVIGVLGILAALAGVALLLYMIFRRRKTRCNNLLAIMRDLSASSCPTGRKSITSRGTSRTGNRSGWVARSWSMRA